jgi:RNA polymerase sigma factor (sigma-70 family)
METPNVIEEVVPKNVEEFLNSKWAAKVKTAIAKARLYDDPEDTFQDVLLRMVRAKYLERYDPQRYEFSTYLYGLVGNLIRTRGGRQNNDTVRRIEQGPSIDAEDPTNEFSLHNVLPEENLESAEFSAVVDEILDELSKPQYKAHSSNFYTGNPADGFGDEYKERRYQRDLRTVFELLAKGLSSSQIATLFGTSTSFIASLVAKLRDMPRVQELLVA